MEQGKYDATDSKLFTAIQEGLPLVEKPFAEIGFRLSIQEEDTLERIKAFKDAKVIRSLAAVFYPRQLGFLERLVAFHIPSRDDEGFAEVLANHPGVAECHECNHDYNVWFTLVVPPGSDPEQHIEKLAALTKATAFRSLPILTVFKQTAVLPLLGWSSLSQEEPPPAVTGVGQQDDPVYETLSPASIRIVQQVQTGLSLEPKPFEPIASELGISPQELLSKLAKMMVSSRMAGIAALPDPAILGFTLGTWILWVAPESRLEEIARVLSSDPMVLHCSRRSVYPAWPYNLYTWLRVASSSELDEATARLASATGIEEHITISGVREIVSRRKIFYIPDDWQWEKAHLGPRTL